MTTTDEEIQHFNGIMKKLSETSGISFIRLAKEAFKCKKEEIGMRFLEREKSVLTKIPQYVELGKWSKAIELTMETYDAGMLNAVLDKMFNQMSLEEFIGSLSVHKKAFPLIIEFFKQKHPDFTEDFLKSNGLYEELMMLCLEKFFVARTYGERTRYINKATSSLQELTKRDKEEWKFYATYLQDLQKSILLKEDMIKENVIKSDSTDFDKPVFSYLSEAILNEKFNYAESKGTKNFEITGKKINTLRIKCYASINGIEPIKTANSIIKPDNANYLAFAEACIDHKLYESAVDFLKKVQGEEHFDYKYTLLKYMNKFSEALEMVISDKECDHKEALVKDLISLDESLAGQVKGLCVKYRVQLQI